jgi:hypothetical protein
MNRCNPLTGTMLIALAVSVPAVALSLPPMRRLIEQSMVWHMVVQAPLLVLGGWLWMSAMAHTRAAHVLTPWNRYGLTGFLAAQAIVAYWMLPLAIDRAVVLLHADLFKVMTLFVCGLLLRHSFERSPAVLQLFFVGYTVTMTTWLGVYFATTELRLCSSYSLEGQADAGRGMVLIGSALGCVWLIAAVRQVQAKRQSGFA